MEIEVTYSEAGVSVMDENANILFYKMNGVHPVLTGAEYRGMQYSLKNSRWSDVYGKIVDVVYTPFIGWVATVHNMFLVKHHGLYDTEGVVISEENFLKRLNKVAEQNEPIAKVLKEYGQYDIISRVEMVEILRVLGVSLVEEIARSYDYKVSGCVENVKRTFRFHYPSLKLL